MSHRFKEIRKDASYLVPVDVRCDRCGSKAKIIGAGLQTIAWGAAAGHLQGGDDFRADLCHDCTIELYEWLQVGRGKGPRVGYEEPEIIPADEPTPPTIHPAQIDRIIDEINHRPGDGSSVQEFLRLNRDLFA